MSKKDKPDDNGGSHVREPRLPKPKDNSGGALIDRTPPSRELILI